VPAPLARYKATPYLRARQGWAARVAAGGVICHLCGKAIGAGQPFDLDHVRDSVGTLAPTHPTCNRSEGARWRGRKRLAWGSGRDASR
jgi:hypothetical protein